MPAVRVSSPLGPRRGVDVELGKIFGGSNDYAEIRKYYAAQVRFAFRGEDPGSVRRYWFLGLKYFDRIKFNKLSRARSHEPDLAGTLGYGWSRQIHKKAKLATEIGISGGDGFLLYAAVGVQLVPFSKHPNP